MFDRATRERLRFETPQGAISVEDLWELPLTSRSATRANLDDIARHYYGLLKKGEDISFVVKERKSDDVTQLRFDIVKHIIDVKLKEKEESEQQAARKEQKQKILAILADKEMESLKGKSVEELTALANAL